jgi:hypothetical protein
LSRAQHWVALSLRPSDASVDVTDARIIVSDAAASYEAWFNCGLQLRMASFLRLKAAYDRARLVYEL